MGAALETLLRCFKPDQNELHIYVSGPYGVPVDRYIDELARSLRCDVLRSPDDQSPYERRHLAQAEYESNGMSNIFFFHANQLVARQYRFRVPAFPEGITVTSQCSIDEVQASAMASLRVGLITMAQFQLLEEMAKVFFMQQTANYSDQHSLFVLLQPSEMAYRRDVINQLDDKPAIRAYYAESLQCINQLYAGDTFSYRYYSLVVPVEEFVEPTRLQITTLAFTIMNRVMALRQARVWGLPLPDREIELRRPSANLMQTVRLRAGNPAPLPPPGVNLASMWQAEERMMAAGAAAAAAASPASVRNGQSGAQSARASSDRPRASNSSPLRRQVSIVRETRWVEGPPSALLAQAVDPDLAAVTEGTLPPTAERKAPYQPTSLSRSDSSHSSTQGSVSSGSTLDTHSAPNVNETIVQPQLSPARLALMRTTSADDLRKQQIKKQSSKNNKTNRPGLLVSREPTLNCYGELMQHNPTPSSPVSATLLRDTSRGSRLGPFNFSHVQ
jgi:hypothetical protein